MLYAIVGLIFLLADQFLKFWTVSHVELNALPGIELIRGLVNITYIKNPGIAFGLFGDVAALRWILLVLLAAFAAFIVAGLITGYLRTGFSRWTGALLLTGLLGNGIDRAIYGFTVDMIEVSLGRNSWIFNIADCMIVVFGILFCISLLTGGIGAPRRKSKARRRAAPSAGTRSKSAGRAPASRSGPASGAPKKRRPAQGSAGNKPAGQKPRPQTAPAAKPVEGPEVREAAVPSQPARVESAPVETVARPAAAPVVPEKAPRPKSAPQSAAVPAEPAEANIRPTSETIAAQAAEAAAAARRAEEMVNAVTADDFDLDDILSEFK